MVKKVSILIPCYNAARWLTETLDSVVAQTWGNLEVIVVNDGSTDESLAIARRYEARGVRVIDQPNGGQSAAFNRALSEASGEYVEFLDADDLLAPDKIAAQMEMAASLPSSALLTGSWTRFYADHTAAEFRPDSLWEPVLDPVEWLVRSWTNQHMMHGAAWLVPMDLVRRAGGWNDSLSLINDFDFFTRIVLQCESVHFCRTARTFYRSNVPGSLSSAHSDKAWQSAYTSMSLGTEALLRRENSPRTRRACACAWQGLYYDSYPAVPHLRRAARHNIAALGESLGPGPGGPKFRLVARLVGWNLARRLQLATTRRRPSAS